jgi:hypothetical protein
VAGGCCSRIRGSCRRALRDARADCGVRRAYFIFAPPTGEGFSLYTILAYTRESARWRFCVARLLRVTLPPDSPCVRRLFTSARGPHRKPGTAVTP